MLSNSDRHLSALGVAARAFASLAAAAVAPAAALTATSLAASPGEGEAKGAPHTSTTLDDAFTTRKESRCCCCEGMEGGLVKVDISCSDVCFRLEPHPEAAAAAAEVTGRGGSAKSRKSSEWGMLTSHLHCPCKTTLARNLSTAIVCSDVERLRQAVKLFMPGPAAVWDGLLNAVDVCVLFGACREAECDGWGGGCARLLEFVLLPCTTAADLSAAAAAECRMEA